MRAKAKRIVIGFLALTGSVGAGLVILWITVYMPWALNWGATVQEIGRWMPGDEIVQRPTFNATRAVTIRARPEEIWPWIVQIGYRKAGFYSWDRLDNDGIPSAERILDEYQNIAVGDTIPLSKEAGARVVELDPNRFLLLVVETDHDAHGPWTWGWGLYPQDDQHTRLVTRLRVQLDSSRSNLFLTTFEIVMPARVRRPPALPLQGD
jgi:hypothetical protein